MTVGRGARAGLLAGVFGAFIWLFATIALNAVVAPLQERMVDAMIRNAQDMPPDVRAWLAARPELAAHLYAAGHGFNCDQRGSYHAASAKLARERTLAFFRQHLG